MAAAWFLVLVAAGLGLTRAGPVPTSKPPSMQTGCDTGMFKYLLSTEWESMRKAKNALEKSLKNQSCSSCLFPRPWTLTELQVWERPVALEAELALTLKVLQTVADSSLEDVLDQPLHTMKYIHSKLQACVSTQPVAGPTPCGLLQDWLHQLQEVPEKVSQDCLEATVTFNLFRLLACDLKCVAEGDLCVRT
ncbi:interferon lambda-1-like [Molossus molossus]|uniref:interferon lambda-1-like n=1 Tax=Molossus molossus TaxID=27622 RepID=UPI001746AE62|nr:interferon lambda-1-like [Molossus molossus]